MHSIIKINIKPIFLPILFLIFFFAFFLFIFISTSSAQVKDAIAVRVMKNFSHLSPARWYMENVPNPGNPRSIQIDGYEAVRDGRTVYAAAANVDIAGNNIYTNIYIMSYNKDAKESTVKIFNKLVKNWRFNINIDNLGICENQNIDGDNITCSSDFDCIIEEVSHGLCQADKSKIRRDVKRLADLEDIKKDLTNYSQKTGFYPGLEQGTYLSRISTSKWPSWQEELSLKLGTNISIDPINRFSGDCDLAGYNSETCWNEIVKNFQCPDDSYLYQYSSLGICSLHCDSADPPNSTFCSNNSDCPCNQGGAGALLECQGFINQEYCMKSSASAGIALNLESELDPMPYSFNMAVLAPAPDCASSRIYAALALENINCCEPISCSSLMYDCGTYANDCGQMITCTSGDTDANGVCFSGECINGFCCASSCIGKECGDDGCGSSCGICEPEHFCDSNFECISNCIDECWPKGETECSGTFTADGREQINYCGYYDADPCLEWSPVPEDCEWPKFCNPATDICSCIPTTCAANPTWCGSHNNGCGIMLECGGCGAGEICDASGICCAPATCAANPTWCGSHDDGCGGTIDCGACVNLNNQCSLGNCICDIGWDDCDSDGDCDCDISGTNICWIGACCTPTTCADNSTWCGSHDDGCGGTIDCGVCANPNNQCSLGNCICDTNWTACDGSSLDADGCECNTGSGDYICIGVDCERCCEFGDSDFDDCILCL